MVIGGGGEGGRGIQHDWEGVGWVTSVVWYGRVTVGRVSLAAGDIYLSKKRRAMTWPIMTFLTSYRPINSRGPFNCCSFYTDHACDKMFWKVAVNISEDSDLRRQPQNDNAANSIRCFLTCLSFSYVEGCSLKLQIDLCRGFIYGCRCLVHAKTLNPKGISQPLLSKSLEYPQL